MKKKVTAAVSIAVCAALGICACSSGRESSSFTGDATEEPSYQAKLNAISPEAYSGIEGLDLEPGTYISVIGKEDESAYWKQIKAGVEQAAVDLNEELGYSGDDEIKVIFNAPGEPEDIDEQVNILDEELARYPDVIAISSIDAEASSVQFDLATMNGIPDAEASSVQFDLATMNGIPIVAFESGNTYQGIQCTCSTDNTQAAQTAAQQLCSSIDEDGEVMLVVPDSVSQSSKDQVSAFREELLSNHLDVNLAGVIYMDQLDTMKRQAAAEQLNIAYDDVVKASDIASGDETAADSGDESVQQAAELLEEVDAIAGEMDDEDVVAWYFEQNPDLKGCLGTSAEATQLILGAADRTEGLDDMVVIGFDAGKDQVDALENEEIDGLIVQNPFGMGYAAVVAAARTVLQSGNEAQVDTGFIWVDQENLEDENIQAMLYE